MPRHRPFENYTLYQLLGAKSVPNSRNTRPMRQHSLHAAARSLVSLPDGAHPKAAETLSSELAPSESPPLVQVIPTTAGTIVKLDLQLVEHPILGDTKIRVRE